MAKIRFKEISFSYKGIYAPIFDNLNLEIDSNWRLGLVGRNGRGKSTFLKLISGELAFDKGELIKECKTESFPFMLDQDLKALITLDVIKECAGGFYSLEKNIDDIHTLYEYIELDGYSIESRIRKEAYSIQLNAQCLERPFNTLSEGEQVKALIISLFLRQNTFVMLDEPTNHLDEEGKLALKHYLKGKKGFIIASHNREFIDETVDHILSINKTDISIQKGNYSNWKESETIKEAYEIRTKRNLVKAISNLEKNAVEKRDWAEVSNNQKYRYASNCRTNGSQSYMKQAKRAEKNIALGIHKKKALLKNYEAINTLDFFQDEVAVDWLISVKNLSFSYIENEKLLSNINIELKQGDALWIKGKNGCGKSTLVKLLVKQIPNNFVEYVKQDLAFALLPQDIRINSKLSGHEYLTTTLNSKSEINESIRLCDLFDINAEKLSKPCSTYSNGEKKKVLMAKTLSQKENILILDEPLNHMDICFREQLEEALHSIKPTLIFIEHDKGFGNRIATKILDLDNQG